MFGWVQSLVEQVQSWSIRALSANEPKYLAPKEASECFDLVRLLSEVPHVWTCLDRQSGQYLGNVSKQLRTQMRQSTAYSRWPSSLHSGKFAQKMALFSTMQPTLHTLILSRYAMSAQNTEELIGCEWPKLQFLKIRLCTATMEECCSAIATLADGHWPSLNELHIIHKAVPRFYSRSGEAAIRLYLHGRWPDSGLFVASDFWPTKDGSCQHTHRQMVFDAAPGDEYRDMLLQSACRYSVTAAAVVQELQRAHVKMRRQRRQCVNLHVLLLAQNAVSCCVHERQRRECDDLYLETMSASVRTQLKDLVCRRR